MEYTIRDIDRYVRGELSPQEMHALEKMALSDPILADALEGSTQISPDEWNEDLRNLRQDLEKASSPKKSNLHILRSWPLKIAASITLILVSFLAIKQSLKNTEKFERSQKEQILPSTGNPDPFPHDSIFTQNPIAESEKSKDQVKHNQNLKKNDLALNREEVSAAPIKEEIHIKQPLPGQEDPSKIATLSPAVEPLPQENTMAQKPSEQKEKQGIKYTVSGKIFDFDDGEPLPAVNVFVKGQGQGTISDQYGNFSILLDNRENTLQFSFIGMETQELNVSKNEILEVAMKSDVSELSEVVVIGYTGEEPENVPYTYEAAEPDGGRRAYRKYLEQGLQYPVVALENKVEGKVSVQFTIDITGQLSNFRVTRGLGYGCDEEVIRLIKEGPHWKPSKRNDELITGKVKVKVRFTLPENQQKK